jgi:hypothetical protein
MGYKICQVQTTNGLGDIKEGWIEEFEDLCSRYIEEGYVPVGGLIITGDFALQAIWRPVCPPEEK